MEHEILIAVVAAVTTGIASGGLGSYVAIKVLMNEIKWMNRMITKHDEELLVLQGRIIEQSMYKE